MGLEGHCRHVASAEGGRRPDVRVGGGAGPQPGNCPDLRAKGRGYSKPCGVRSGQGQEGACVCFRILSLRASRKVIAVKEPDL